MGENEDNKGAPVVNPPTTVVIDGKEIPVEEVAKIVKNQAKFKADYDKKAERAKQADALEAELAVLKGKQDPPPKRKGLPPIEDDSFLDALVGTVETLTDRLEELNGRVGQVSKSHETDVHGRVQEHNITIIKKFLVENEFDQLATDDPEEWPDDVKKLAQQAMYSPHNSIPAGSKIPKISTKALEDALILLHKDEIVKKSEERGRKSVLDEIIGKKRSATGKKPVAEEPPTLAWLAENWETLSDEERDRHYERVYGRKKVN